MFRFIVLCALLLAAVNAFAPTRSAAPARMTMLFSFGKKAASKPAAKATQTTSKAVSKPAGKASGWKGGQTANVGTYVPEGLTAAQYEQVLANQAAQANKKKQKFPKGKEPETLTEWMLKEKAKGNEGKGLLLKGHRMVKAKDDGWYTSESPV